LLAEKWRRLRVQFPPGIPTHSTEQVFLVDRNGLLRRLGNRADPVGSTAIAHYCYDHQDFSGLILPTRRRAFARRDDGTPAPEATIVQVDIANVTLS
jgi:hypothetical protein